MTSQALITKEAIAAFPELRWLVRLRDRGWRFSRIVRDGVLTAVVGVRTWGEGWADAIGVRYVTDAQGVRSNPTGERVWERTGTLAEVVHGLMELPEPGEPNAPRLAIGAAPRLWTPHVR